MYKCTHRRDYRMQTAMCWRMERQRSKGWGEGRRGDVDSYIPSAFWFLNWDFACDFFYLRMTQKVIESARVHIQELGQLEKSQIMFQLHLISHAYLWLITCDYLILRKECSIMEKTRTSKSNRLMFKTLLYLI